MPGAAPLRDCVEACFGPRAAGQGRLIVICGFDGSGKTTQIGLAEAALGAAGHRVLVTRQPTEAFRQDPEVRRYLQLGGDGEQAMALARKVAADRHHHCETVLRPALAEGMTVLCDRYVFSSFALFAARGIDAPTIAALNRGIPRPDLAFYLDLGAEDLVRRLRARDGQPQKYDERSIASVARICAAFRAMAGPLILLEAARPAEVIARDIRARIAALP